MGHIDNVDVARILIEYSADINAKDRSGWTPLYTTATKGIPFI